MSEQDFLEKIIDIKQPMEDNPVRLSIVGILLRGARKLTGRNLDTGVYNGSEISESEIYDQTFYSNQFTGLINYLILLEQLGSIFKKKENDSIQKNGIRRSLDNFSALEKGSIPAIIALRNCLTHKYGLATEKKPRNGVPFKFTLSRERNALIVNKPTPENQWKGDFSNKSEDSNTIIYFIDFENLVEEIYLTINKELKEKKLELYLEGKLDELKTRFTMVF